MEFKKTKLSKVVTAALGSTMLFSGVSAFAQVNPDAPCAYLPADRATEFHGNAAHADLRLAMAGNQWVVFDKVLQGFNHYRGLLNSNAAGKQEPRHHENKEPDNKGNLSDFWTLNKLNDPLRQYYVQLIPPGQLKKQIKSGCLVLGNDEERNFLPGNIQVEFDVYASTTNKDTDELILGGFMNSAVPYIKNILDLMVAEGNPKGIGTAGAPGTYENTYDIVMDLLDPNIAVSEVDHINEGIHNAINKMYKAMDQYVRTNGSGADIAALDAALSAVAAPQDNSPAATRTGVTTDFNLASNAECHYAADIDTNSDGDLNDVNDITAGTLRFCEFAILNKANTHETRVHHVETPNAILGIGDVAADVGPVWTSELGYQLARNVPVEGIQGGDPSNLGVPSPDGIINAPNTYYIGVLNNAASADVAQQFIDFVLSPEGQQIYADGGFIKQNP